MDGNDRALTAFTMLGHATFHTYELVVPIFVVSGLLGVLVFLEAPVNQEVISKHVPADLRGRSFGWTYVAVFGVGALAVFIGEDRAPLVRLEEGEAVELQHENGQVRLNLPDGTVYAVSAHFAPEGAFGVTARGGEETWTYAGELAVLSTWASALLPWSVSAAMRW